MISVVLPTFNRPAMLRQALTSVLAQSYSEFEVIICDDASDDRTRDVITELADPRFRYLRSDENVGFMANSMRGYMAAQRPFVITLHDDDVWEPELLSQLLRPLTQSPELAGSFCDHWVITQDGRVDYALTDRTSRSYGRAKLQTGPIEGGAGALLVDHAVPFILGTLVRREAIEWNGVPPETWRIFEFWLLYRLALTGRRLYYVSERLAYYRRHPGSATAQAGAEWHACFAYCWRSMAADESLRRYRPYFLRRLDESNAMLAIQLLREKRADEARRVARQSLEERLTRRGAAVAALAHLPRPLAQGVTTVRWRRDRS